MPATATGRGAQVLLDPLSDTAKAVRGAYAPTFEANAAKVAADVVAGVVSDGNRPDGTTSTAGTATDPAITPLSGLPAGAAPVLTVTSAGAAVSSGNYGMPTQGGITATGTTSAGAYALTAGISSVTVAVNHGVRLPGNALTGSRWVIFNNDAGSAVNVYPPTGHAFFSLAFDAPINVALSTKLIAIYFGFGTWLREN